MRTGGTYADLTGRKETEARVCFRSSGGSQEQMEVRYNFGLISTDEET